MPSRQLSTIASRAAQLKDGVRAALARRHPNLSRASLDQGSLVLGTDQKGRQVTVPGRALLEHTLIVGATGSGKSKMAEHQVRQSIANGLGVCVLDPHGNSNGSLYQSILTWMEAEGFTKSRTVHLIDPNATTHITGFDPLSLPDETYDPAVIADAVLEAIEKLWGESTDQKPTLQRVLVALVTALCELRLTLAELPLLFDDPDDRHGIRAWMISELKNEVARGELQWLDEIAREHRGRAEYRLEVTGPRNRFAKLLNLESLALMLGQQDKVVDFRAALDNQHIILANLGPGPRLSDKGSQLLGRLLLRTLFFHAQRRVHPERICRVFIDECQLLLSGDVARLLSEIRKSGIACVLASQFLAQYEAAGPEVLAAVKSNTNVKIVFRSRDPQEAAELAEAVIPFDLERPVQTLVKPSVIGHRVRMMHSDTESRQLSTTLTRGHTQGRSENVSLGRSRSFTESQTKSRAATSSQSFSATSGWNETLGASRSATASRSSGEGRSAGSSRSDSFQPPPPPGILFQDQPVHTGTTIAQSADLSQSHTVSAGVSDSRSVSSGISGSYGSSHGLARTTGYSNGTAASRGETRAVARGINESTSLSRGETSGISRGIGSQEGLEPLYQALPTAVHGLENLRYLAGQLIRNLPTGHAVVSFVGPNGIESCALKVPNIEASAASAQQCDALRQRVLRESPSASAIEDARAHVSWRRELLVAEAQAMVSAPREPVSPGGYRIKRKRATKHNERKPANIDRQ